MKKKYLLFALAFAGLTLTACSGSGSIGLEYDETDLEIDTEWVEYSLPITKVNFDEGETSIRVERGKTHEYSYSIEPAKAVKKSLLWESADADIATVASGVVTAKEIGKTKITVSNAVGSFTPMDLDVEVYVPVENIAFEQSTLVADFNHQYQLEVTFTPSDTTETALSWHCSNEELATIDEETGLLTTKAVTGTVTVTANSASINQTIEMTVDIADRTIYPDTVTLTEFEESVEIGHDFTMKAVSSVSSDPTLQVTHPEVKYYSTDSTVLSVEEDTGVVHALDIGTASIYATAQGKTGVITSAQKTVSVFEVRVESISVDDITLSNRNGRSDIAIPFTYTTDKAGYDKASIPNFTYTVADTSVAVADVNGKIHAVAASGNTTITVTDTRTGVSNSAAVFVGYEVDTVTVTGASEVDVGSDIQLSVVTDPTGVPADLITYSSSNLSVATVSSTGLVSGVAEGNATITVTVTGMNGTVVETHPVAVNVPDIPFAYGKTYVVGDHNYVSGESKASATGSWDKANQARVLEQSKGPSGTLLYEEYTIIKFNQGDLWKLRNADRFLEIDGIDKSGTPYYSLGYYQTNEGAFAGSNPDMSVTNDGDKNVVVNRTGYYAIYHKQYTNDHAEGWFEIYVGRHELNVSDLSPQVKVGTSTIIEAHDWKGDLSHNVTEGSDLITVTRGTGDDNYKFTITAGANTGTAKITFEDEWTSVEVVVSITSDAPATTFDDGIPYIIGNADYHSGTAVGKHDYWESNPSKAFKCEKYENGKPSDAWMQYRAVITFEEDNEFQVIIGGDPLYWDAIYQTEEGAFAKHQMNKPSSNVVVASAGTYTIYVKSIVDNGGWKVMVMEKEGGGDDPTYDHDFYLIGVGGNEDIDNAPAFTKESDTHYYLENVTLAMGDEIKANNPTTGQWLGVDHAWQEYWEVSSENNNLKVLIAGSYTVSLDTDSSDGNYLSLSPTVVPDPTIEEYTATIAIDLTALQAKFSHTISNVSLYVWTNDGLTKPLGTWAECEGNLDDGSVSFTATKQVSNFVLYLTEQGEGTKQTINLSCDLQETGNYYVDFSDLDWTNVGTQEEQDWKMINVSIESGTIPDPDPEPTTLKTFYFTNANSYKMSGTIYAHVWNSEDTDHPLAAWPGTAMTYVYTNDYGEDVYSITINTALYNYIIFNNNSKQTVDIALSSFGSNNACNVSNEDAQGKYIVSYWNYEG